LAAAFWLASSCGEPAVVGAESAVKSEKEKEAPEVLQFKMKSLTGKEINLAEKYQGKVLLIVNTASKCGLTPQYKELQQLHEDYAEKGLAVLGFPCNQFGHQEPGSAEQIAGFCKENYGVTFDMFSKIEVNGKDACDLYKYLTKLETKPAEAGDISWNFEKFLVDHEGHVVARFSPKTKPDAPEVVKTLEEALARAAKESKDQK
jgi:glutathione peroxidase